jgi:uncharacterized membrane protein
MSARAPTPTRPFVAPEVQRRENWILFLVWIASVVPLFGGSLAWILVEEPENAGWIWAQMVGLATLPGKYVIFSGVAEVSPLGPWALAVVAVLVDVVVASMLALVLAPLGRVPVVGPALRRIHARAEDVLREYPRLRRMAFWGVVIFVFLPLPASGSIGGTFVGQLLGLTRLRGLVAVVVGGALVSAVFAGLAVALGHQAQAMIENPWVSGTCIALFAVVVFVAWRAARKALKH